MASTEVAPTDVQETNLCDKLSSMKIDRSTLDSTTTAPGQVREYFRSTYAQQRSEKMSVNEKIKQLHERLYPAELQKYGDVTKFNGGIRALGIDNFLAAAAQFCKDEAGPVIVSVGSGSGFIEENIGRAHLQRFGGGTISIKLIESDPNYKATVNFTSVDHFVRECPEAVGNCVVLIIWPNDEDKIDALRKLQPVAALVLYETLGNSGSEILRAFLSDNSLDDSEKEVYGVNNWRSPISALASTENGLDNYSVEELARQKIVIGSTADTTIFRLVKMKRTGPARSYQAEISQQSGKEKHGKVVVAKPITERRVRTCFAKELMKKDASADYVDDLNTVLKKLGLHDRRHDLEYIVEQAEVDYTTLDATNEMDHARIMLNAHLSFTELPHLRDEIIERCVSQSNKKRDLSDYKDGIIALGVEKFLSVAVQFCKESRKTKAEIVSVGTADGCTERHIVAAYEKRFGKKISIRLVDSVSEYSVSSGPYFRSVSDLIEKRPYIVGHCVLLILWPERAGINRGYDLDAIRELRPEAALIVYENTGRSGSHILREYLHDASLDLSPSSDEFGFQNFLDQACRVKRQDIGLADYSIKEIAREKVRLRPVSGTFTIRMVKLMRKNAGKSALIHAK